MFSLEEECAPPKFVPSDQLVSKLLSMPRPWVMTNGVFDLLHRGHVQYLQEARQLGPTLIVAVNSDASARSLGKGPDRPLNRAVDRIWVLAALDAVSVVTMFEESTPLRLLEQVKPDIYVKGGDYDMSVMKEAELVASWGGRSLALGHRKNYSTTALVARINAAHSHSGRLPDN